MLKLLAVIRTLFLVFVIGFTVRAMPFWSNVAKTFDEQYARCAEGFGLVIRAVWIAIGWIAFETALGWWMATRPPKLPVNVPPAGTPPFAPPPRE